MIVVDSGAWVAYFNGAESPHAECLERALAAELDLGILPIVVTEVLQGFRTESGFRRARALLTALPIITPTLETHVRAAVLCRPHPVRSLQPLHRRSELHCRTLGVR
jgi:predicted nucleic acid-binding protein